MEKKKYNHKGSAVFWMMWTWKLLGMKGSKKTGQRCKGRLFLQGRETWEKIRPHQRPVVSQMWSLVHKLCIEKVKIMKFKGKFSCTFAPLKSPYLYKHLYQAIKNH